jgi:hypothetical protein
MLTQAFDIARSCGVNFWFLDIGGGFPGYDGSESLASTECCVARYT